MLLERLRPPQPQPHADQRVGEVQGSPMGPEPLRGLRGGLLLSKSPTSLSWRWITSSPKTRAAPMPSTTFRRSVSAETPANGIPVVPATAVLRPARGSGRVLLEKELAQYIADAYFPSSWGRRAGLIYPRGTEIRRGAVGFGISCSLAFGPKANR